MATTAALSQSMYLILTAILGYLSILSVQSIVFVHGLGGHPEKTWSTEAAKPAGGLFSLLGRRIAPETGTVFWPKDLLPQTIKNARIMTYGYEADPVAVWSAVDRTNIFQHSRDLLITLSAERLDEPLRPLIFIAHSLGGILVKDALKQSRDAEHTPDLLPLYQATYGIIFMSVPHRGSNWVKLAENMLALAHGSADVRVVRALDVNSDILERVMMEFAVLLKDGTFKVHTFQETKDMIGIPGFRGKIVEPFSCVIGDARELVQTLSGNHSSMCKFNGIGDDNYNKIRAVATGYMRGIEKTVDVRPMPAHRGAQRNKANPLASTVQITLKNLGSDAITFIYFDANGQSHDGIVEPGELKPTEFRINVTYNLELYCQREQRIVRMVFSQPEHMDLNEYFGTKKAVGVRPVPEHRGVQRSNANPLGFTVQITLKNLGFYSITFTYLDTGGQPCHGIVHPGQLKPMEFLVNVPYNFELYCQREKRDVGIVFSRPEDMALNKYFV